jgi:hypothetical protein
MIDDTLYRSVVPEDIPELLRAAKDGTHLEARS